jgi:hypothetical protein
VTSEGATSRRIGSSRLIAGGVAALAAVLVSSGATADDAAPIVACLKARVAACERYYMGRMAESAMAFRSRRDELEVASDTQKLESERTRHREYLDKLSGLADECEHEAQRACMAVECEK